MGSSIRDRIYKMFYKMNKIEILSIMKNPVNHV
jgi:hypothetical protein